MVNFIKKILDDKKEYKEMMARVEALPGDYPETYKKICNYMWGFASGSGMDMLRIQYDLIDLFEAGAADGKDVLEVTGEDVIAFANGLTDQAKRWDDKLRNNLNKSILNRVGKKK
jgi:DNA-binding ferritin-like protein (Dps family)